jgi:hypothetical protein
MRQLFILIKLTVLLIQGRANVFYIDVNRITDHAGQKERFEKIREWAHFYDHWTPDWQYDKSKEELITFLEQSYSEFSDIKTENAERNLLLGTLSHYLYNLGREEYNQQAIRYLSKTSSRVADDYRADWFLGVHYSLSNVPDKAVSCLIAAKEKLQGEGPVAFWESFVVTAAIANMPSHAIYAMEKVKEISGTPGNFEEQLGKTVKDRLKKPELTTSYEKEEIWSVDEGDMPSFVCRPLGIRVTVDSVWNLSLNGYSKGQSAVIIKPSALRSKQGREVNYTIAILMKTVSDEESLESYINKFVVEFSSKSRISFSDKFDRMIAYEIREPSMYEALGGAHLYMIGVERSAPDYPGLLLEKPSKAFRGTPGELNYYRPGDYYDRFKGRLFYAIILDACEDIHEAAYAVFKEFWDNGLLIE